MQEYTRQLHRFYQAIIYVMKTVLPVICTVSYIVVPLPHPCLVPLAGGRHSCVR